MTPTAFYGNLCLFPFFIGVGAVQNLLDYIGVLGILNWSTSRDLNIYRFFLRCFHIFQIIKGHDVVEFSLADFSPPFFSLMARRSPRKKVISPVTVANSDEEEFAAVASDDQYMIFFCLLSIFLIFIFYRIDLCTSDDESAESPQDRNRGKKKVDLVPKRKKHNVAVRKNQAADDELEDDEV